MDRKGQIGLAMILGTFMAVLVGAVLFVTIAQEVGSSTTLDNIDNFTIGTVTNGTDYYFVNYRSLTSVILTNETGAATVVIPSTNYSITNNVINPDTGALSVRLSPNATSPDYSGNSWNVSSAVGQPVTYIANSGARSVAGLITIFFALAIVVVSIIPSMRSKIFG
jgi:heptaprenylglyceryl phosphate synthase